MELGEGSGTREVGQEKLGKALGCPLDRFGGEFGSWERVEGVSSLLQMLAMLGSGARVWFYWLGGSRYEEWMAQ